MDGKVSSRKTDLEKQTNWPSLTKMMLCMGRCISVHIGELNGLQLVFSTACFKYVHLLGSYMH